MCGGSIPPGATDRSLRCAASQRSGPPMPGARPSRCSNFSPGIKARTLPPPTGERYDSSRARSPSVRGPNPACPQESGRAGMAQVGNDHGCSPLVLLRPNDPWLVRAASLSRMARYTRGANPMALLRRRRVRVRRGGPRSRSAANLRRRPMLTGNFRPLFCGTGF